MHNVVLQKHIDNLKNTKGISFKEAYITANIKKDFENADFRDARLQDIKMEDAVFKECDFSGATITADITNVKFIRCNFENATLYHAHIFDSAFIDNNFIKAHFLHSSIRQTELSKNDFTITTMDGVIMSDITVEEDNINGNTISYGFPGATREELNHMIDKCMGEITGTAEAISQGIKDGTIIQEESINDSTNSYDMAIEEALQAAELPETEISMEM